MRFLLIAPLVIFGLAACATNQISAEQCANARLALVLAEANNLDPDVIAQARINVEILCPSEPRPIPRPE